MYGAGAAPRGAVAAIGEDLTEVFVGGGVRQPVPKVPTGVDPALCSRPRAPDGRQCLASVVLVGYESQSYKLIQFYKESLGPRSSKPLSFIQYTGIQARARRAQGRATYTHTSLVSRQSTLRASELLKTQQAIQSYDTCPVGAVGGSISLVVHR